jgi:hypothetical protein
MIDTVKESLWNQFGASIDMLENSILLWPDGYWESDKRFFYRAYHTLVFLDYYLTMTPSEFVPLLPFTLAEPGVELEGLLDDIVPDRIYSKGEMLGWVEVCRDKLRRLISGLTVAKLSERWIEVMDGKETMNYAVLEILLYNMRHVQHHTAQLNMLLREHGEDAAGWVSGSGK